MSNFDGGQLTAVVPLSCIVYAANADLTYYLSQVHNILEQIIQMK